MQIYKTRSDIGAKETCFYVYLTLPNHPYPSWFSLWAKPQQVGTKGRWENWYKKDPSGNSVVPTPFSSYQSLPMTNQGQCALTVGSEIYVIGGPYDKPSSFVRILDCRSNTWRDGPNMTMARENASAIFRDKKIYVIGRCEDFASWIEVFDMDTQSWTALPGPGADEDELLNHLRARYHYCIFDVFEGKLWVEVGGKKEYAYDLKDGTWKLVREKSRFSFPSLSDWCEIDNILYGCTGLGDLMWSPKTEGREWSKIKGLENLREHRTKGLESGWHFKIVGFGRQKLLVMWKFSGINQKKKK
ncbi:unnamed protein product [Microthlaspi erraticum]|uniref:FKB95-like N-terminal Kelch domain-containing protein n=1 Tax=Microthlaspi erraticum TaxID=1685480 RepID=A0A6D2I387_9BRAS|nr:unnamed protein product [Microthlaspi erraticum]CAA7055748.1 unnamed protein product [Microthlaspi erraticum]